MVDWQYSSKDSAQLLGRILDCEYPKEKYVVVGAQKGRILTPNQHKNKRKSSLNAWKPLQNPQISLMHTYVLHHVPRFIQKASVDIIYNRIMSRHCRPSGRHAWCDWICNLNLNCDLSGAHSIWIYDADPWDETSDSSMSNRLRFTSLGHTYKRLWLEITKRPHEASVWFRHAAAQSLR